MSMVEPAYRYRGDGTPNVLFAEAERQLNICNSCRYCEGYCAVYPALERRTVLNENDIIFLANLCHDCRACLYACMYAPPHEFGVNPPAILAEVRRGTYRTRIPSPARRPRAARRPTLGLTPYLIATLSLAVVALLVAVERGLSSLFRPLDPAGSPYALISYESIVTVSLIITGFSMIVGLSGVVSYWQKARGSMRELFHLVPWMKALRDGATLRYLRGGAEGCYVKETHASPERRLLHYFVSYGFLLCLIATIAAAVEQDILSLSPPFGLGSLPVISGALGGAGLIIGSAGLLRLNATQQVIATDGTMTSMDRYFLIALLVLGATGIVTLVARSLSIYGLVLAVHLSVVWACLILAPYSKFVHFLYRLLALVQDNLERADSSVER